VVEAAGVELLWTAVHQQLVNFRSLNPDRFAQIAPCKYVIGTAHQDLAACSIRVGCASFVAAKAPTSHVRGATRPKNQCMRIPPSTMRVEPCTKSALGEINQVAASAICSALPTLPTAATT